MKSVLESLLESVLESLLESVLESLLEFLLESVGCPRSTLEVGAPVRRGVAETAPIWILGGGRAGRALRVWAFPFKVYRATAVYLLGAG